MVKYERVYPFQCSFSIVVVVIMTMIRSLIVTYLPIVNLEGCSNWYPEL